MKFKNQASKLPVTNFDKLVEKKKKKKDKRHGELLPNRRILEATWKAEREAWEKEKKELKGRIEDLERKVRKMEEGGAGNEEEARKAAEKRLEEEVKGVKELSEEQWEEEKMEREGRAKTLVISAWAKETTKEKLIEMLKEETVRGIKEEKLGERKGKDGITRWFYKLDREEEKRAMLERGEKIRGKWGLRVSGEKTFRERKTKQILERRADYERAVNKEARIQIDRCWICVEGKWQRWLEKEARWMEEKDWVQKRKEEERRRLKEKLAALDKGLEGKEETGEGKE